MNSRLSFAEMLDHHPGQSASGLADKALRQACALLEADAGVLYLLRHDPDGEYLVHAGSFPTAGQTGASIPSDRPSIATIAAQTGSTLKFDDATTPDALATINTAVDLQSGFVAGAIAGFPLTNHAKVIVGVLVLATELGSGRSFSQAPLELFVRFCRLAGAAVERADLLEQINQIRLDPGARNDRLRQQVEKLAFIEEIEGVRGDDAFRLAISMLARAAEIYDEGTGNHVFRVNEYSHFLGKTLGQDAKYCHQLRFSAQLHDVGKMGVAPSVLRKTSALNPDERREMDNHTIYGHRILSQSPRLAMAADIALNHHEKWDGSGYPSGKRADEIPLSARIVQIADIYDALRSERPYKPALEHEQARHIILHGDARIDSAGHFDPTLVEVFADTHQSFNQIWQNLQEA
jgi:HD-GYP domain-containing protein (c-di-GMP phosphodiesterase class II)